MWMSFIVAAVSCATNGGRLVPRPSLRPCPTSWLEISAPDEALRLLAKRDR